ncbi:MAG: hypothetical protein GY950_03495, partial [bacterium]|nr:hypothetical protein [bacterium]
MIFFFTAAVEAIDPWRLRLPEAEFVREEPFYGLPVIRVKDDGKVYFEQRFIEDLSKLPSMIKDSFEECGVEENKVLIRADMRAEFGDIQKVLKAVKKADIDTVGLIAYLVSRGPK